MITLTTIANLCTIAEFILSLVVYIETHRKEK